MLPTEARPGVTHTRTHTKKKKKQSNVKSRCAVGNRERKRKRKKDSTLGEGRGKRTKELAFICVSLFFFSPSVNYIHQPSNNNNSRLTFNNKHAKESEEEGRTNAAQRR